MNEREITQMNLYSWSALGKQTAQVSYSNGIKLLRGLRPLCTVKTMTKYHKNKICLCLSHYYNIKLRLRKDNLPKNPNKIQISKQL